MGTFGTWLAELCETWLGDPFDFLALELEFGIGGAGGIDAFEPFFSKRLAKPGGGGGALGISVLA